MNEPIQSSGETVPETRDICDACNVLARAISLNEVLFMAGEGLGDRKMAEAVTTQCDFINDLLIDVRTILHAHLTGRGEA